MRRFIGVLSFAVAVALIAGCTKKSNESKTESQQGSTPSGGMAIPDAVAGIHWTVPRGWTAQPKQPMRAATYTVPSPKTDIAAGDCGVFFFGQGQGGTVEDNLDRWVSQFENGGKHEFGNKEINNLKVTTIRVSGTYLAPSGPMMESQGKKPNYRLLGAIVEAPDGMVFFKFTGPAQTVDASESNFNNLLNSLAKDE